MQIEKDALIAAAEEKRRKRLEEVEAAYHRDLEAIDIVLGLQGEATNHVPENGRHRELAQTPPATNVVARHYIREDWPGWPVAIRRAVAAQTENFGLDAVLNYVSARFPERSLKRVEVSRELWRLNRKNQLVVVEAGAGKRPAIYKKATETQGESKQ